MVLIVKRILRNTLDRGDKVGVLILAFNRHKSFSRLIECLLTNTSQEIFISVDGGCTKDNEQVRNLANAFKNKYPTKIHINLMSENHGLRRGVIKGIDWFFENVEIGIILEEDLEILTTNPQNLFSSMFKFLNFNCDTVINLSTFTTVKNPQAVENNSLVFYKNQDFYMWGWATHKTVWEGFKSNLSSNNFKQFLKTIPMSKIRERIYWIAINRLVMKRQIDSWGYSFLFYSLVHQTLYVPSKPIVRNNGFLIGANYSKFSFFDKALENTSAGRFHVTENSLKICGQNEFVFERNRKIRHNITNYTTLKAIFWNLFPIRRFLKKIKK